MHKKQNMYFTFFAYTESDDNVKVNRTKLARIDTNTSNSDKQPSPQQLATKPSPQLFNKLQLRSNKVSAPSHSKKNSMGIVVSPPISPKSPMFDGKSVIFEPMKPLKKPLIMNNLSNNRSNANIHNPRFNNRQKSLGVHRNSMSFTDDFVFPGGRKRNASLHGLRDRFGSMDDFNHNLNLSNNPSFNYDKHHNHNHTHKPSHGGGDTVGFRTRNPTLTFDNDMFDYDDEVDGSGSEDDDDHEDTVNDFNHYLDKVVQRKTNKQVCFYFLYCYWQSCC